MFELNWNGLNPENEDKAEVRRLQSDFKLNSMYGRAGPVHPFRNDLGHSQDPGAQTMAAS